MTVNIPLGDSPCPRPFSLGVKAAVRREMMPNLRLAGPHRACRKTLRSPVITGAAGSLYGSGNRPVRQSLLNSSRPSCMDAPSPFAGRAGMEGYYSQAANTRVQKAFVQFQSGCALLHAPVGTGMTLVPAERAADHPQLGRNRHRPGLFMENVRAGGCPDRRAALRRHCRQDAGAGV